MAKALDSVRNGASIRSASHLYGIPESTIRDKIKLRYSKSSPGAPPILKYEDENCIVDWLIGMAKAGLPINTQRLRAFVAKYIKIAKIKNPFKTGIPGTKWVAGFLKRHPKISRRVASSLSKSRAKVSPEQIKLWFEEISAYIKEGNLQEAMKKPKQIFNMDETAVRTIPTRDVVLAEANGKQVHTRVGNSDKESYTALFSGNAAGMLAPTMMLFPYKQRVPGDIYRKLPKGWAAGKTDSGWMTRDTFFLYMRDVFHPWLLREKIEFPVVIFVDGHSSHVSAESIAFCKEKNMALICLPPNTTQITQPLDVSFFRPLKQYWNQLLVEWRIDHAGDLLPRSEIAPLLHKAVKRMDNLESILMNGFKRCGLYPWDVNAVNYSALLDRLTTTEGATHENRANEDFSNEPQASGNHANLLAEVQAYMTQKQIDVFNRSDSSNEWLGCPEETALFHVWQKIKKDQRSPTPTEMPVRVQVRTSLDAEPSFIGFGESLGSPKRNAPLDMSYRPSERSRDALKEIFCIPTIEKKQTPNTKSKPVPPSVATSDAYEMYLENIENIKTTKLLHKETKWNGKRRGSY
ncbi:uncharacterized protein LOC134227440 [Armigeres subalbatus]|uniref:uncharacterized protein LOC134227440 n=1 Tax=Armigeres subalbatus TaxID=124917 RepID=UPI002ED40500